MRRWFLGLVVMVAALVAPAAAFACPADNGPAPAAAKNSICGAWNAIGDGNLGRPLNEAHRWGNGWIRDFDGGAWSRGGLMFSDTDQGWTFAVSGPYWQSYARNNGPNGLLGYPTGRHTLNGNYNVGTAETNYLTFQGGNIINWAGGAFAVYGSIFTKYAAQDYGAGPLGRPTDEEQNTARVTGRFQAFERGNIIFNPQAGAFTVYGGILNKYAQLGYSNHALGLPRDDRKRNEALSADYQSFDGGVIVQYNGGAYEVHGAIKDRWDRSGDASGPLGLPASDEQDAKPSPQGTQGRFSRFQNGYIDYNPRINKAIVLFGAIKDKYAAMGFSGSYLGLPTSEEFDWEGGKRQNFEGGYVWWHRQYGTYADREKPNPASLQPPPVAAPPPASPAGAPAQRPPPPPQQTQPPPASSPSSRQRSYVALGDSVAAGEGTLYGYAWIKGRWRSPAGKGSSVTWLTSPDDVLGVCHRSGISYPYILARRQGLKIRSLACTGAATFGGILRSQQHELDPGLAVTPAQLGGFGSPQSVAYDGARPEVVTLQLGANDVAFSEELKKCYRADCGDANSARRVKKALDTQKNNLRSTLGEIARRGKSTGLMPTVYVGTYFDPFPGDYKRCSDTDGRIISEKYLVSPEEMLTLRRWLLRLNSNIREVTTSFTNAKLVSLESVMDGHRLCSGDPWVYGPSIYKELDQAAKFLLGGQVSPAPFHPTPAGQLAIANAFARALGS